MNRSQCRIHLSLALINWENYDQFKKKLLDMEGRPAFIVWKILFST